MDNIKQEKIVPEIKHFPAADTPPESLNLPVPETAIPIKEREITTETTTPEIKLPTPEKKLLSKLPFRKKKILPAAQQFPRSELAIKVEKIMEENIRESYEKLSPIARQEFKIKGEETANKISIMLGAAKVKAKAIFRMILEWLFMLPGVNRFFLEQEAKIKTDRILTLKNRD